MRKLKANAEIIIKLKNAVYTIVTTIVTRPTIVTATVKGIYK